MSLINEALRKARQAAAEHEDRRTVGRPPQAYPSRGPRRGAGPAAVVLVAVLAGLGGAAGVWWIVGTAANDPVTRDAPAPQTPPKMESAGPSNDPAADAEPTGEAEQSSADQSDRAVDTRPSARSTAANPEVAAPQSESVPPTVVPDPVRPLVTASGERVFIMDAELGYASLSLGYIVFRPVRPFAEINGKDVYEGSVIDGFKVERIEIDRVVLRDDRGPLELRVP